MNEVLARIEAERVVAVLRAHSPGELREVALALRDGGVRCLEFTMTTPGALDLLKEAVAELGSELLLGAGTVLDAETARAAILAGARFLVSPSLRAEVVTLGKRYGIPVMPGAFTPGEVLAAWEAGADVVKVFPAGQLGPGYLKDLHGPFPYIPLMPTGGISPDNAADYLNAGAVAVGIGGNLTRRGPGETVADLTGRARRLMENVRNLKTPG
jgi:2-dehydro-3-deoxyphosphogluconate aldolase/(4S)-4-hydroxy-2-oxoglutarate aldolase